MIRIALVNTNRIRPPIAPIGLDYVAEALSSAGHHVQLLDLCWADDCGSAITDFFEATSFNLVGVTLRNTDDCAFTSRHSFLRDLAEIVGMIRHRTAAPIVLGGVGFSVMPETILDQCEADAGLWGEGEFALQELAHRIEGKLDWHNLPGLIWRRDGRWHRNPPTTPALTDLPPMSRGYIDNKRYYLEGGQAGIETKRGCPRRCIYCADPIAKGRKTRVRSPAAVADELGRLLQQGIDHIHTCDSEFNLPQWHAIEVCQEIIRRDLGDKLRWYAYCSPAPFSQPLANLMRRAGCAGINFGVDHGDATMLRRLGRDFGPDDIVRATLACRAAGMAVMLDLLLGAPGESRSSIEGAVQFLRRADPDRIGVSVGVRVYPGTELAGMVMQGTLRDGLSGVEHAADPLFFLEPGVAPFAFELLDQLIDDDRRFFFFDPAKPARNYNYNANQRLVDAIRAGYRGAYWDILRRYE